MVNFKSKPMHFNDDIIKSFKFYDYESECSNICIQYINNGFKAKPCAQNLNQ